mmetsp:Transcript_12662/g.21866  ORF Transcript_12662/g.21866 Transcript_12662/m.21866 type:complete len:149 (-) Transcript_12662:200-646(-)
MTPAAVQRLVHRARPLFWSCPGLHGQIRHDGLSRQKTGLVLSLPSLRIGMKVGLSRTIDNLPLGRNNRPSGRNHCPFGRNHQAPLRSQPPSAPWRSQQLPLNICPVVACCVLYQIVDRDYFDRDYFNREAAALERGTSCRELDAQFGS